MRTNICDSHPIERGIKVHRNGKSLSKQSGLALGSGTIPLRTGFLISTVEFPQFQYLGKASLMLEGFTALLTSSPDKFCARLDAISDVHSKTTTETYTANEVQVIAYFLCPETLTALLLLSRQAGGYQDVVKEVGLEPAIKLAKYTASE
ncbi:unnamed protein product [Vicia faba]|uniref:Uncharacterized protein n=1 Tax=Vicia faba TaxID=3906 RepID=A0AAV0Z1X1_VICFA|nr:unnamed protein product [Vicia faba]